MSELRSCVKVEVDVLDSPGVPVYLMLVPAPLLFSVHLHGMTFPFLSDRNPLWTHSNLM